ncbi:MAG: hypothetical protein HY657_08565 [Acidobacteria bacterium]|nr:hypothetical protein [Acidobacteriota bacterium]
MANRYADTEFAVLRQTIAWRGTTRMVLVPVTLIGWAGLSVILLLYGNAPVAALFPLAVLAGGFEAIHALHVGTERIGRYLQVYYETDREGPRWETTALAVGPALPGGGIDPLFSVVFAASGVLNLIPAWVPQPTTLELGVLGTLHVAFLFRVVRARGAASRQRALELESFKALRLRERADAPNHPIA